MLKTIPKSNISKRNFKVYKEWSLSNSDYAVVSASNSYGSDNYSNNPTFVTGSDNSFAESTFEKDPRTFITTVGLYSDANELIAVAKTSQPVPKSFDKEVLIKVKLDF